MFVSELSHNPDGLTMCLPIPATSNTSAVCCKCGGSIENIPDYLLNVADMVCRKCSTPVRKPKPPKPIEEIKCRDCGKTFPETDYQLYSSGSRGKSCLLCRRAYARELDRKKREAKRNAA